MDKSKNPYCHFCGKKREICGTGNTPLCSKKTGFNKAVSDKIISRFPESMQKIFFAMKKYTAKELLEEKNKKNDT